ncbi:MAG TPA: outer membrane lipoprotein carrier protein LolA [Terriglobales bacterium]|nr:outer membrane lipoprotein carrier protein LolA [Terriglobales bacterium]
MKVLRSSRLLLLFALLPLACAQQASGPKSDGALERVLAQMDKTAANFRTTEASFVWNQYSKVVDETDTQKGKVYFRRASNDIEMAADITDPEKKYVLFNDSKVQVYQPKIDQVTVYNTGKNREAFESFLVLGFGGRGHDMLKSFDVKYAGTETVEGVEAAKLDLTPKSQKVANTFAHILLWIDPARGVSVQQQLFEPSGDYRLAKYSEIEINQKIPDTVFKLKTTGKTKIVSPQG